jgi:hypothetical protein
MKPLLSVFLFASLIACSPYKKIVLTASDRLTKKWKGTSEETINTAYGVYKRKAGTSDGYLLLYDYSYASAGSKKSGDYQVRVSNQRTSPMLPPPADPYNNAGNASDSVIRRVVFYFDQSRHVQYVDATGFPDSVYYIKRK